MNEKHAGFAQVRANCICPAIPADLSLWGSCVCGYKRDGERRERREREGERRERRERGEREGERREGRERWKEKGGERKRERKHRGCSVASDNKRRWGKGEGAEDLRKDCPVASKGKRQEWKEEKSYG